MQNNKKVSDFSSLEVIPGKCRHLFNFFLIFNIYFLLFFIFPVWATDVIVKTPVLNIEYTESGDILLSAKGFIKNSSTLAVRGIKTTISFIDEKDKNISSLNLDEISILDSQKAIPFEVKHTLVNQKPARIRAVSDVSYNSITYLEIADWIMSKEKYSLDLWHISYPPEIFTDERTRVYQAVNTLFEVNLNNPDYKEAKEKRNTIMYNYALRMAESQNCHEAILHFFNIEEGCGFYTLAQSKVIECRPAAMYKNAMEKAVKYKNYLCALELIKKIPPNNKYFEQAKEKIKNWEIIIKTKHLRKKYKYPPYYLSYDQRKIWQMMGGGPEGTVETNRGNNYIKSWWYPDYSHFTFNKNGKLLKSVVYH